MMSPTASDTELLFANTFHGVDLFLKGLRRASTQVTTEVEVFQFCVQLCKAQLLKLRLCLWFSCRAGHRPSSLLYDFCNRHLFRASAGAIVPPVRFRDPVPFCYQEPL